LRRQPDDTPVYDDSEHEHHGKLCGAFGHGHTNLFKKIPKIFSYILWLAVLIRLVCPMSFNLDVSLLGLLNTSLQANAGVMEYVPQDIGVAQQPMVDVGIRSINQSVNASLPAPTPMASANPVQIVMEITATLWSYGVLIILILSFISYYKVINKVATATRVRDNIYETDQISTPFVCGWIHPKIYIPIGTIEPELTYILAHEQTHIRRWDHRIKPFAFLLLILHWFNPILWLSFALMSKDMEMSCDEAVLKRMGSDIKSSYSHSLLSLSVKRKGFMTPSPLAFGESNIKSRIKNILRYKQMARGTMVVAIFATASLIVAFTANPTHPSSGSTTYWSYNTDALMENKTLYVGNNSRDIALIDALPLPKGIARDTVALQTVAPPYGIVIHYHMIGVDGAHPSESLMGDSFCRNAILLFGLIRNVDVITFCPADGDESFTYTRDEANRLVGGDVQNQTTNSITLKKCIDQIRDRSFAPNTIAQLNRNAQVNQLLETIVSSPKVSSNPQDYIHAHSNEYESILKMGDGALYYMLAQFETGTHNDLKGNIMMTLCKKLLGARDTVTNKQLAPQDWFSQLTF